MQKTFLQLWVLGLALSLVACQPAKPVSTAKKTTPDPEMPARGAFQSTLDSAATDLFYLKNDAGIHVAITNYGARVVSLWVKDQQGAWTDVILGFDSLAQYQRSGESFYGPIVGRYCNRMKKGSFKLDGKTYQLPLNNGANTLHGGPGGFHNVVWTAKQVNPSTLELTYVSPAGEMGFPGTLTVKVVYTLTDDPGLRVDYEATTDAPTVLALTSHGFYNLNGEGSGSTADHLLQLAAANITPIDSSLIPTGKYMEVAGTPFDFRTPKTIGSQLNMDNEQMKYGKGYDHNYVLDAGLTDSLHPAAVIIGDKTKIRMEVTTTEPGIQFYGGNFMNGGQTGKAGKAYDFRTAFCLETQHFPDSPNIPAFPSTTLRLGQTYKTSTMHRFSVAK